MRRNRIVAAASFASVVVALPLLSACGTDALTNPMIPGASGENNARASFLATEGGKGTKATQLERTKAQFSESGGQASLKVAIANFHDLNDLTEASSSPGVFFNTGRTAVVMPQPDADDNGIADTFFIATEYNLPGGRLERGLAYVGPVTYSGVIEDHRRGSLVATYTGNAGVTGTVGNANVDAKGTVRVRTDFVKATVEGEMTLSGAPQFDGASFVGYLTSELSDFSIDSATLTRGGSPVTDDNANGVGSFMGVRGQAVMGTFAKSSQIDGTTDNANVFGYFIGSSDYLR